MAAPSPAKPWELQRGASEIGASPSIVGRRVPIGPTSGSVSQFTANPSATSTDSSKDATKKAKKDKADKVDKPEKASAPSAPPTVINSGAGAPGYGMNGQTSMGGYGGGMMGQRPFGGMGYSGSSMYGGGYGSSYGGYGGGYGMGGYVAHKIS
jgi:peroxin-13